jgi:uroporphyrinogen decarboxylase
MRPEQWQLFKAAAKGQPIARTPLALIIDSPWIPGYLGINHLDYYFDPDIWFEANRKIIEEFPDVIVFPSWWVEYGMAIEPSALGIRLHFYGNHTPDQTASLFRIEDVEKLQPVDPCKDGFMPIALQRYRTQKQRIFDAGYTIPAVTARGPLCTAAFVRGVNELMVDLAENPEMAHRLIQLSTDAVISWLKAQAEVIGDSVEGIFVLDDIVGFLSRRMYQEFAHPYLKQICDAFPKDWVKVYHNDANVRPFLADLPDTGFDVLNFTHNLDIAKVREQTGGRICLMGNVSPLEIGIRGTAEQVRAESLKVLGRMNGSGMILSLGGGVSPDMPRENISAMASALADYESA